MLFLFVCFFIAMHVVILSWGIYNDNAKFSGKESIDTPAGQGISCSNNMAINWTGLFADKILKRGWQYCQENRVAEVKLMRSTPAGDRYGAIVIGNDVYFVQIVVGETSIVDMKCECPYARDGHRCKHMAAALYEMQNRGIIEDFQLGANPEEVFPFKKTKESDTDIEQPKSEYRYYDMERITKDVVIDEALFDKATKLVDSGKVTLDSVQEGYKHIYDGDYRATISKVIIAEGTYFGKTGKRSELQIIATQNQLIIADCNAVRCHSSVDNTFYRGDRYKLCEHLVALMILLDRHIDKYNPGDATDRAALDFLRKYRNKAAAGRRLKAGSDESGEKKAIVHLEPRLEIGQYDELAASFKVGKGKDYVVKDITELSDTVENSGEYLLGKTGKLDFASETFDEESAKYYEFIAKEVKGEALRDHNARLVTRYNTEPGGESIKASMPLFGKRLDEFFELVNGHRLPFVNKKGNVRQQGEAILQDRMPDIHLEAAPFLDENERFGGINLHGEFPKLIDGINYQYYFENNALNRVAIEELELLNMLRDSRYSSEIDIDIGRKNMSEFYYRILPMLEEIADVNVQDEEMLKEYLYPEGVFKFFLDADEENVTCDVKVSYGDAEAVIMEPSAQSGGFEAFRDMQREKEVDITVRGYLPYQDPETAAYHCNGDESLVFSLVQNGVSELLEFGEVQATDRFKNLKIRRKAQISVGVSLESDLLNLSISSGDLSEEELLELLASYRKKKKFHRLRNGDFMPVNSVALEELSAMLDVMKVSPADFVKGKMHLPLYRAIYLDRMLEKNDELYAKRDKHFKNLIRNFKTVGDSDYEVPESLQGIMRGYQEFGYKWLRTIEACGFGGILADDMGLGKTLQVIAVLLAAKEAAADSTSDIVNVTDTANMPALIVTPASLVYNWQEEFAKFAPELNVGTVVGAKAERRKKLNQYSKYDVLITSYDLLKRDVDAYEGKKFSYHIIDEAQYIKNHTTAASKSVKVIESNVRFALTGTPIENRLSELWSIFDFLMPGFLYSYAQFRKEMELPITKSRDEVAMAQLRRMVEPFILRRLKSEVLKDLPDKIEETQYVAFENVQQQLYDAQTVRMKRMLKEGSDEDFAKNKIRILAEITRIRQICCDPSLCFEDYDGESAKREAAIELIKSAVDGEHKMLVFSQFTSMLDILKQELETEGISYYEITGTTKKEDRIELVKRFNSDDTPVFLISLKAGGTGLNLTGADIVIHYDPWWNLAAQNQATDRAYRIGQEKKVTVYKLIVKNSIEEKILKLQEEKKALADEILSGETGGLMTMSREELMELF